MSLRVGILIEGSIWSAADRLRLSCSNRASKKEALLVLFARLSVSSRPWTKNPHFVSAGSPRGCQKINWAGKSVNLKWFQSNESFKIKISIITFLQKHFFPSSLCARVMTIPRNVPGRPSGCWSRESAGAGLLKRQQEPRAGHRVKGGEPALE